MSDVVKADLRGQVLWITLNRPEAMNALDGAVVDGLRSAASLAMDDAVRVVVATGTGRAFSVGADLKALARTNGSFDPAAAQSFTEQASAAISDIARIPKPVIAAVNGLALAGGLELAMACDIVIASRSAKLGDAHSNYGLLPGGGASVRLPRLVGPQLAKRMMFTGEFLTATALQRAGLVTEVVEDEQLEGRVTQLANELASKSPLVLRAIKTLVSRNLEDSIDAGIRNELDAFADHLHTQDFLEGLTAFREGRQPSFLGR